VEFLVKLPGMLSTVIENGPHPAATTSNLSLYPAHGFILDCSYC